MVNSYSHNHASEPAWQSLGRIERNCLLCRGLSTEELHYLAAQGRLMKVPAKAAISRREDRAALYIITRGRVRQERRAGGLGPATVEYLTKGDHFGAMSALTDRPESTTCTAVMETELLCLDADRLDRVLMHIPGFAANLSRALGYHMHWQQSGRRQRSKSTLVAIVHGASRLPSLAVPLAESLAAQGETTVIATDQSDVVPFGQRGRVERIADAEAQQASQIEARLHDLVEQNDRVFVEINGDLPTSQLAQLLSACEEILWLVPSDQAPLGASRLRQLINHDHAIAERVHWVWALGATEQFAPLMPEAFTIAAPDFKLQLGPTGYDSSLHGKQGINRLIRHLCRARIGLALSGGGARGLAHLGVMKALAETGVEIDLVAGTSSGALMGFSFAGRWELDFALESFRHDLTPPKWIRKLPGGVQWYLAAMFRPGAWDKKLRPYLNDLQIQQFQIPFSTVAADLVSGQTAVADQGDAVDCILDSINIPGLSQPRLRAGRALVDGGILNNLPADVLLERGADFVIGVDVVAKLPHHFGPNRPETPLAGMRRLGRVSTLLRVNEVQYRALSGARSGLIDVMIEPDTSRFEFADFSRATELAQKGEEAVHAIADELKSALEAFGAAPGHSAPPVRQVPLVARRTG